MDPIKFRTRLFGFQRKQVLSYVDETCARYEQMLAGQAWQHQSELAATRADFEEKLRLRDHALSQQTALNQQYAQQIDRMSADRQADQTRIGGLEEQLAQEKRQEAQLSQELTDTRAREEGLSTRLRDAEQAVAQKEKAIVRQSEELVLLRDHVDKLEEKLREFRADADQSTALVDCVNLLHSRNRALTNKVARLEAELENSKADRQVAHATAPVEDRREGLKTAEALFAALQKELSEALGSMKSAIEQEDPSEGEGNYYVDLADL